ncbi:MAG: 3'-5' exonuclease [Tannerellaceae bacterium]|jgi:DNA polymerase-3 subunit epsilon|nr:3'-5' exonuclease [Tannerellaceae bacterium]
MEENTNFKNISNSFAAIDFETANEQLTSVCSVGIVIVKEGMIVDRFYHLIHPEPDYYLYLNTQIHGITAEDTDKAPVFPVVWKMIEKRIEGLPLIAHNKDFDENCLKAVFKTYCMDYPDYDFHCTLQAARKLFKNLPNHKLNTVATYCGYNLENHHHALADAEACAMIALFVNKK